MMRLEEEEDDDNVVCAFLVAEMARRYSAVRKQVRIRVVRVTFEMGESGGTGGGKVGRRKGVGEFGCCCGESSLRVGVGEAGVVGGRVCRSVGVWLVVGGDLRGV